MMLAITSNLMLRFERMMTARRHEQTLASI
jgi:hypothetical protein